MRIIDADESLNRIWSHHNNVKCDNETMAYNYGVQDCYYEIEHAPTVPQFGKWVSIEDDRPDEDTPVLVHVVGSDWDEPDEYISIDSLHDGLWKAHHLSVTHWMPLPEAPERRQDEAKVRHGYWVPEKGWINRGIYKCSICGNFLNMSGVNAGRSDAHYCPCCGAKMDKKMAEEGDGE